MLVVPRTQALSGAPSTSGAEAAVEVLIGTAMGSGGEGEAFRLLRRCAALGIDGEDCAVGTRGAMRGQFYPGDQVIKFIRNFKCSTSRVCVPSALVWVDLLLLIKSVLVKKPYTRVIYASRDGGARDDLSLHASSVGQPIAWDERQRRGDRAVRHELVRRGHAWVAQAASQQGDERVDRIDAGEPRLERREGVLVLERRCAEARSEPPALGLGRELARGEL